MAIDPIFDKHQEMLATAIKMLIGKKASFIGVVFGIFLATLLISQQSAIFLGLVSRSYRLVTDIPLPNIWVIDPETESDDKARSMPSMFLEVVRGVPGVEWAVPINVTNIPMTTPSGNYQICELYGIDDASLMGAPQNMLAGSIDNLRQDRAVIVDVYSANGILATTLPDKKVKPLAIGDSFEINKQRAVVVGICRVTQGFYPQPIIFTTNSNFQVFNPLARGTVEFIAAKSVPDADVDKILRDISGFSGLKALNRDQFKQRITNHFLKTGILINFGLSVALGFIIGFSIAGQIFYMMTLENMPYYALIKAIGGTDRMVFKMIIVQALTVGAIGFLLGTGATLIWGLAVKDTTLAFMFPWQLLLFTSFVVLIICISTAALSIRKVFKVDPKVLMGN